MTRFTMEIIGIVAGFCTTVSFVPQVIHTWRTKSVADISFRMYLFLCLGIVLWIVYGVLVESLSVILANGVTLLLASAVLFMKIYYGRPSTKSLDKNP